MLGVFALEVALLTTLAGGSFGQLLDRLRVLTTEGRPLNLLLALARTLLICLVIPPLVFKPDSGRGPARPVDGVGGVPSPLIRRFRAAPTGACPTLAPTRDRSGET